MIPLHLDAFETLVDWHSKFDNPLPGHFVFPSGRYGLDGEEGYKNGAVAVWDFDPTKPIGSWKVAWSACRKAAGVSCRLHDLRHTFVSRLGEAKVADSTLTALSGWMSRKMLERYSHTRNDAKRRAVDSPVPKLKETLHKIPHSEKSMKWQVFSKLLILNGRQGGVRTRNPRLRRPVLYPVELLAHAYLL